jgi:peptidoglycan/LPS O-acetylase OafA/YrhL
VSKDPFSPSHARFFLGLLALFWLAFGLIVAANAHPSYKDGSPFRWAMTAIAWVLAACLAVLALRLRQNDRLGYGLTVALLSSLILVGLLDELGIADLDYLLFTFIPLVLLIKDRRRYRGPPASVVPNRPGA